MMQYQQTSNQHESGGILFSSFSDAGSVLVIEQASDPQPLDRRSRHEYIPDAPSAQKQINIMFKKGLHYVGEWHSHPEAIASPSPKDKRTIKDIYRKSTHELSHILIVIIGTVDDFDKSFVAFANDKVIYPCTRICNTKLEAHIQSATNP